MTNYEPTQAADMVPPSRLFELARARFETAIATTRIAGSRMSPSPIVAVMAIQQAEQGVRSLKSVLVPSTPTDVRTRAARAVEYATTGIDLLRRYHAAIIGLGDAAHRNEDLPASTLELILDARAQLQTAGAIARSA